MKRKSELAEDLARLQRLGFRAGSEEGEYAFQPDSGSIFGEDERGENEYGIHSEFTDTSLKNKNSNSRMLLDLSEVDGEGRGFEVDPHLLDRDFSVSEFSSHSSESPDDNNLPEGYSEGLEYREWMVDLVGQRIQEHPKLMHESIEVDLDAGRIRLSGEVQSEAHRLIAREIAQAVVGNQVIDDHMRISKAAH